MLPKRIKDFLNAGSEVVAETSDADANLTVFVRIRALAKPGVPREARRFLNSTWSMWEYWDYRFRRVELRRGWRDYPDSYDFYVARDETVTTIDEAGFNAAVRDWVPDVKRLRHTSESSCPL